VWSFSLQVVVDRFADVEALHFVSVRHRFFVDDVRRLGRVIAADVEEVADIVFLQHLENGHAILLGRFLADRAERGGGGVGDFFEGLGGFLAEVDEVFLRGCRFDAVQRAVNVFDLSLVFLRLDAPRRSGSG
jgi:hypothetical protein